MAPTHSNPDITTREQAVVEAWSQGLNVGAEIILILIVLCNYRRKTLLHKLILGELLLAVGHGFFAFFEEPEYGWYRPTDVQNPHNSSANYLQDPQQHRNSIIYLPYWVLETWANFQYHNNLGIKIFDTTRLFEPLARDPWWVFTTIKLVLAINENYDFTIPGLVRTSPRFGIMLLCLFLSIVFLVTDVIFMIVVSKRGGMNPFWRLALVFKCASDVIFLDDFKSVLDRISESAMRKITTFEYRDNASPSGNPLDPPGFSAPGFQRKNSRAGSRGFMQRPMGSRDDGHFEFALSYNQPFSDEGEKNLEIL
ncbi:hypothetical protein NW762_001510 [Fusarium torreyae]|uniref:Uncharacterized protein n=1 Tax=Fusarium torreyae TaxID=1237075 RepID=A0A9W8VLA8_9HYPO|nr:hypothetical protein NW762_001510 [Fusarium torreyae]